MTASDIEALLDRLYIDAPGAKLRKEDKKKALELAGLVAELRRLPRGSGTGHELLVVDAAAGKGYVGLLAATVLAPVHVVLIERDPRRLAAAEEAALRSRPSGGRFSFHSGDVSDPTMWPASPDLVVALHACGAAADAILAAAIRAAARRLLVVPCCTPASERSTVEALGIPRHSAVRRGFLESLVAAERTLRLESAGYQTEVVPLVPPTVTPYNLVYRARRVREPGRMRDAERQLARLAAI